MIDSAAPPLVRRKDDRIIRGVCAAIGRATGTDPVLWRVAFVVLAIFGGSGLLLYGAGWLLIPEEGSEGSLAERWIRRHNLSRSGVVAVVLVLVIVLAVLEGHRGGGLAPLLAVALLAYVALRSPAEGTPAAPRSAAPAGSVPAAGPAAGGAPEDPLPGLGDAGASAPPAPPAGAPQPVPAVPAPPVARRRRSALGPLTVGAALLTAGILLALAAAGVPGITAGRLIAAALAVVGAGLLIGAFWGRARGLIALAVLLAAALGVTTAARTPVGLSAGTRTWSVSGTSSYRLGVGDATVDLRPLGAAPPVGPVSVRAQLGAGELRILLPSNARVELTARISAGRAVLPDEPVPVAGGGARLVRTYGPADAPLVHLDAELGAGQLKVLHDQP
jgi:phage shock protein PspC (stress-responsive transcriptional regulator)